MVILLDWGWKMGAMPTPENGARSAARQPGALQPAAAPRLAIAAAALFAVTLWGGTPVATKLAVVGLDGLAVGILRTVLSALAVLPLLAFTGLRPPRSANGRSYLLASALCGFVIFPILFGLGIERTSAGHGAVLIAVAPVFTGLIAALLDRKLPGRAWWLGALIAFAGVVFLVSARFGLAGSGSSLTGDLLVVLSYLAGATGYVTGARAAREVGSWAVTVWGSLIGTLLLLPLMPFVLSYDALAAAGPWLWGALGYLAVGSSVIAYGAWYWALAKDDIGKTGSIQFLQPLIGLALAALLLGEDLSPALLAAAAVIILGVALAQRRPAP